jgi:hypothetical protein
VLLGNKLGKMPFPANSKNEKSNSYARTSSQLLILVQKKAIAIPSKMPFFSTNMMLGRVDKVTQQAWICNQIY